MIELRLKRTGENACCTFGEFRIPKLKFGCRTLELKDGSDLRCKQSCRIPEDDYIVELKINKLGYFAPTIKYRVKGFAVKPKFDLFNHHFTNLLNGDIAIGSEYINQYDIQRSEEINQAFSDACRQLYMDFPHEEFILKVYKVAKDYQYYENDFFKEMIHHSWDFLGDDNEEEDNDTDQ